MNHTERGSLRRAVARAYWSYLWFIFALLLYFVFNNVPPYTVAIYWLGYPMIPAVILGVVYWAVPGHPAKPGMVGSVQGREMHTLIIRVDEEAGKLGIAYRIKVLVAFNPVWFIIFGVLIYTIYVNYFVGLTLLDRITISVAQLALVIAMASFAFGYIKDFMVDSLREIMENEIFPKVVNERYNISVYPVVRAVIRERTKLGKGQKLEDIYNLEPKLFHQDALLKKLLE